MDEQEKRWTSESETNTRMDKREKKTDGQEIEETDRQDKQADG